MKKTRRCCVNRFEIQNNIISAIVCFLCIIIVGGFVGCSSQSESTPKMTIAYQYGLSYAPLLVMKEKNLIQEHYDGELEIDWQVLNSGAAINEGFTAGSIDVGAMGIGPAVIGVTKGIPYRIFAALSSQPQGIMSNQPDIRTLKDIQPDTKIALVNIGAIQHILLAMAAKNEIGNARAFDNNIVAMSHPDGMTALISGAVECQLTTSPYLFMEANEDNLHEVSGIEEIWPDGNTFIVAMASMRLHDDNPSLYLALVEALEESCAFIEENPREAAALLAPFQNVSEEELLSWLEDPGCGYSTTLNGVMKMANFMVEEKFIPTGPESISDLTYENVKGE